MKFWVRPNQVHIDHCVWQSNEETKQSQDKDTKNVFSPFCSEYPSSRFQNDVFFKKYPDFFKEKLACSCKPVVHQCQLSLISG